MLEETPIIMGAVSLAKAVETRPLVRSVWDMFGVSHELTSLEGENLSEISRRYSKIVLSTAIALKVMK